MMYKLLFATAATALAISTAAGQDDGGSPIYGVKLPEGYRDWQMVSVASVGAPQNDLRVKLANPVALKAFRDGTRPFPDGSIIARLAYRQSTSELNNKTFRAAGEKQGVPAAVIEKMLASSFVAGAPTNVQIMVKDSKKYAASGGWGFGEFSAGKPDAEAVHKTCFACHTPAKDQDFVFTQYAP